MHILLDAKDLIDIVEHAKPIDLATFEGYLRSHNSSLVLTFTNVREFVAPIAGSGDFLSIRPFLQAIEKLPVAYIREAPIPAQEIIAALEAFVKGGEPRPIDPYVRRWDYTFAWPGPSAAEIFVGFRLDEIVYRIYRQTPNLFRPYRRHGKRLREQFAAERQLPAGIRKSLRDNFADSVRRRGVQWKIDYGTTNVDAFGHWIYENPLRCPGLRLSYDMYHELLANVGDIPEDSDIPDFAHIKALPYVNLATLDRRMTHYFRTVVRKLQGMQPAIVYDRYIYPTVEELMRAVP